jgi:23S rRNA (adenine2503-C2)-methyltransferase
MELLGKSKEELRAMCAEMGEPAYRGGQIYHALYAERKFDVARMTNLPAALRERLAKEARITLPEVKQRFVSADGSARYLLTLGASEKEKECNAEITENAEKKEIEKTRRLQKPASVEAVFMPDEGRQTICISTQAGCAVDCHFCLTAQLGLIRNLTAGEILAQVLLPLEENKERLAPQTNVVLMGQGEPLLNFRSLMDAVNILADPDGVLAEPRRDRPARGGEICPPFRFGRRHLRIILW